MKNIRVISLLILLAQLISTSHARFQTREDASMQYDFYNRDVVVHKDGTFEEVVEYKITLLKEQARSAVAKYPLNYNSDSQKLELVDAKTIASDGAEYPVELKEDKEIASNAGGFDKLKQLSVHFSKPEIGSSIYIKYKLTTFNSPVANAFAGSYYFGTGGYWLKSRVTINSDIALKLKLNDPFNKMSVTEDSSAEKYKATIELTSPLISDTTDEVGFLAPKKYTKVTLSSFNSWEDLGGQFFAKYDSVIKQKTPALYDDILESAKKQTNIIDQINTVTTMVNDKIEYFGDWRSVKGKYFPNDLEIIAKKQSGDCKDFTVTTANILSNLGFKAQAIFVKRSALERSDPNAMPAYSLFNHAMVKVTDKNGKVYWIDPTNSTSMADGVYPDISGNHVIVLSERSTYEQIDTIKKDHAKSVVTTTISNDKTINKNVKLAGEKAAGLTAAELYLSPERMSEWIYSNFVTNNIDADNRLGVEINPSLTSRNVKPISIAIKYKDMDVFAKTNLGNAYAVSLGDLSFLDDISQVDTSKYVNDIFLNHPRTIERKTIIENLNSTQLESLNFAIDTPYVSMSRNCTQEGKDIIVHEKFSVNKSWIENKEFKSKEFMKLQTLIKANITAPYIVFQQSE